MKKFFSMLLALTMVVAMAVPAFAAGEYSITVTNDNPDISISGKTYEAYKVFDVSYNADKTAYTYTVADEFADFTYNGNSGKDLIALVDSFTSNSDELNAFAAAVLEYAETEGIAADGSATVADDDQRATILLDEPGYYLVAGQATAEDSQTITAACSLTTTKPSADVNVKADAPKLDKIILEADTNVKKGTAVAVGDTVDFQLTSTVPNMVGYDSYTYIVHDTMSDGLTFNNDVAVTIDGVAYTNFDVVVTGQSFTITFNNFIDQKAKAGKNIVITYSATLDNEALVKDVETNTAYLEYSNNPYDEESTANTPNTTVKVYDFDIVIDKFAQGDEDKKLAGAIFELYKGDVKIGEVTTDENGFAAFTGLDSGTYTLKETVAPAGYNKLGNDIQVVITATYAANGDITTNAVSVDHGQYKVTVDVPNQTGSELPSTGGMGTTLFYVVGGLMMAGAAVLLITKKKMAER